MARGSSIIAIPRTRAVYSAAYASLPTTGVKTGDLGYATDRLILYRWSGAAWVPVTIHSSSGLAAAIPSAANLPNGSLFYETDTQKTKQVQSSAWVQINDQSGIPTVFVKSADQTINNSDTPAADNDFVLPCAADSYFQFLFYLMIEQDTTNEGFKFNWAHSGGGTLTLYYGNLYKFYADDQELATLPGSLYFNTPAGMSGAAVIGFGYKQNAGNLTFLWSQIAAAAQNTTLKKGSTWIIWWL